MAGETSGQPCPGMLHMGLPQPLIFPTDRPLGMKHPWGALAPAQPGGALLSQQMFPLRFPPCRASSRRQGQFGHVHGISLSGGQRDWFPPAEFTGVTSLTQISITRFIISSNCTFTYTGRGALGCTCSPLWGAQQWPDSHFFSHHRHFAHHFLAP